MCKPSDRVLPAALTTLALLAPLAAAAGVEVGRSTGRVVPAPAPSMGERARPPGGGYQIRCWQHGRLLFEENRITVPLDSPSYVLRMAGTDRHGRPLYVADTQNATCLVRAASDERYWPR
ncbi:MAG TPA: hypothetical protein VFZ93_00205 [Albitalea sp.]